MNFIMEGSTMKLQIEYLHKDMDPLYRAHDYDAGADVPMWQDTIIYHGKNIIPLGFKLVIPPGYAGYLCARSSVMGKGIPYNMVPFDTDFSGEWRLIIYNPGDKFIIHKGERLCQLVIMPVLVPEFVTEPLNRRGSEGLGSTGK